MQSVPSGTNTAYTTCDLHGWPLQVHFGLASRFGLLLLALELSAKRAAAWKKLPHGPEMQQNSV